MVTHIVLFKLKEMAPADRQEVCLELKMKLEALKDKIDSVVTLEVGINAYYEDKNYDLALVSTFRSLEGLEAYKVHPEHVTVAERVGQVAIARAAADF